MPALPPVEVRRLGDRRRRRTTALATVGGVAAAVVTVGLPLTLLDGSGGDASPPIATGSPSPQVRWPQQVPDDLDLTQGIAGRDTSARVQESPRPGVAEIVLCGRTAYDAPAAAVDVLGAVYAPPGTEGSSERTLSVYADDTAAQRIVAEVRAAVEDCPEDPNGTGLPLLNEVEPTGDTGADDALVFTQQASDAGDLYDLTVFQVLRTGNAVLVTTQHTSAGGDEVKAGELRRAAEGVEPVVAEMARSFTPGS